MTINYSHFIQIPNLIISNMNIIVSSYNSMKSTPTEIQTVYNDALNQKGVPPQIQFHYRKWLRYYLDFCHKYHHKPSIGESVALFIKKLKEKNQTEQQCKQAVDAVSIFCQTAIEKKQKSKTEVLNTNDIKISTKKIALKSYGADWRSV